METHKRAESRDKSAKQSQSMHKGKHKGSPENRLEDGWVIDIDGGQSQSEFKCMVCEMWD